MNNDIHFSQDVQLQNIFPAKGLLEYSHFGYMWMQVKTKKIIASHTIYELLEIEPYTEFLTADAWRKYIHPQDLFMFLQAEEKLFGKGLPVSAEYRMITKTGRHIFVNHHMHLSSSYDNGQKIMSMLDNITEQKRADIILEVMNEGFFELDSNLLFRRMNANAELLLNVNRKELAGRQIWEAFPQSVGSDFYRMIIRAAAEKTSSRQNIIWPLNNHWINISVSPYNDGIIIIFHDIQNEKKAEDELMRAKDLLEAATNTSPLGMAVVKAVRNKEAVITDFEYVWANAIVTNNFVNEDITGLRMVEKYPHLKNIELLAAFVNTVEKNIQTDFEEYYGLKERWFRWIAVKMEEDNLFICVEEITTRKKAEQEQLKNLTLLQQSEYLAQSGSWEYDVNTKQFLWSDGMYKLFEIEKGTPVAPSIYLQKVIAEDKSVAEEIINNIQKKFLPAEITLRIKPDGIVKTAKIKMEPLKNKNGSIEKMLGVDMDITELKKNEEKINGMNKILVSANRQLTSLNSELKTFNAIAATDYRETFHHLYTNLEYLINNDALNLSNSGKANIRRAQSSVQKAKLLTDDIITFSKVQMPESESSVTELNDILQAVTLDLKTKITESSAVIEKENLPSVKGFPLLLELLFYHLLDNAIKFRKQNTYPVIKILYSKITEHQLPGANAADPFHKITISDNGIGFDIAEAEKIFVIFTRLHEKSMYKGSGIGLAICRKIMDLHNGFILAEGIPGETARFHCYFPAG